MQKKLFTPSSGLIGRPYKLGSPTTLKNLLKFRNSKKIYEHKKILYTASPLIEYPEVSLFHISYREVL